MLARVAINLDLGLLPSEGSLEDQSLFQLRERVDGLATWDVVTKDLLKSRLFGADNLVNKMGLPNLVRLDLEHVLPHGHAMTQNQLVLI